MSCVLCLGQLLRGLSELSDIRKQEDGRMEEALVPLHIVGGGRPRMLGTKQESVTRDGS